MGSENKTHTALAGAGPRIQLILATAACALAGLTAVAAAQPAQKITIGIYAPSVEFGAAQARLAYVQGLAGNPPEALVNLGILYDQLGRPREAFDAWTKAKARGVQVRDLQRWIDAKKRIYGF